MPLHALFNSESLARGLTPLRYATVRATPACPFAATTERNLAVQWSSHSMKNGEL